MSRSEEAASTHFQKTNDRKSVLHPVNYRSNITGFPDGETPWKNQIHHILVCYLFKHARILEALNSDAQKAEYCNDCLWVTEWDINGKENLIGLPVWSTYTILYKNQAAQPPNSPTNLPCHTRGHGGKKGYSIDVRIWLKTNIWDGLSVKQEPHPKDLETILEQLKEGEEAWRDELEDRGTRQGGTWNAWVNRRTLPKWYEPFSMAENPKPRKVP